MNQMQSGECGIRNIKSKDICQWEEYRVQSEGPFGADFGVRNHSISGCGVRMAESLALMWNVDCRVLNPK